MNRFTLSSFALVSFSILSASTAAEAGVPMTFAGGNGTPLSLTFSEPIQFTVTVANVFVNDTTSGFGFLLKDVGSVSTFAYTELTGTPAYSVNGGTPLSPNILVAGLTANDLTNNDLYFFTALQFDAVVPGDIVTISAGTLTTVFNVDLATPADGDYTTFMFDNDGIRMSTDATVVPEPATLGLLAFAAPALLRRRR